MAAISALGQFRTRAPPQTALWFDPQISNVASLAGIGCRWSGREDDRCGGATLITLLGGAAAWPVVARAQSAVIGVLGIATAEGYALNMAAA